MNKKEQATDLNRRSFIKGSSFSTLMAMMGGVALKAEDKPAPAAAPIEVKPPPSTVNCGIIGCGQWGREILQTLARLPGNLIGVSVMGVCDTYPTAIRRAKEAAPKAESYTDYRQMLANKDIPAIIVATPSHLHRDIVLEALNAGKHVYCEAPLANTIEDARIIAQAAKKARRSNFQAGLQARAESQRHFLLGFIRSGAMGKTLSVRSQWHKKESWRQTSGNPDREKALNWRLEKEISTGLVGEVGVHHIDVASWFLLGQPIAVTGFGSVLLWNDGREIPDTVQAIYEYPGGVQLVYDCTLANSFDGDYEMYFGTDSAIMVRQSKAWMFKEVDAPLLGWEVYARKDEFYRETGIALVANATKLAAQGTKTEENPYVGTPLAAALEAFLINTDLVKTAVEDFSASFDINDAVALGKYISDIEKDKPPAAGYKEGFEATVAAIKGHEAVMKRERVVIPKELYQI